MTRYSDNIYSGYQAPTSAASSKSAVSLSKTHNFVAAGAAAAQSITGTFPPNTQNLSAALYVTQNGSATVSNKITVSAGGTNLLTIDQFGSAGGFSMGSLAGFARFTVIGSACANLIAPTTGSAGQTVSGEIPYTVTFLPVSADKTGTYQVNLSFNRADTNTLGTTN